MACVDVFWLICESQFYPNHDLLQKTLSWHERVRLQGIEDLPGFAEQPHSRGRLRKEQRLWRVLSHARGKTLRS